MSNARRLLTVSGTVVLLSCLTAVSPASGRQKEPEDYRAWLSAYYQTMPYVRNAISRYASKTGQRASSVLTGRAVEVMHFPTKVCVQFVFIKPSVGGIPIYCYGLTDGAPDASKLLEEYSGSE